MGKTNEQHARDAAAIDALVYWRWQSGEAMADIARSMGVTPPRILQRIEREQERRRCLEAQ